MAGSAIEASTASLYFGEASLGWNRLTFGRNWAVTSTLHLRDMEGLESFQKNSDGSWLQEEMFKNMIFSFQIFNLSFCERKEEEFYSYN